MKKPTIKLRPANERGHANHGWLDSYHTFSFADYYDKNYMGFRTLRVINEDRVGPARGFSAHPHQDMEIFSYVIEGALTHEDDMGNQSTIHAGDVQKITAGTGIVHSEFNASPKEPVHFLQIWILPSQRGLKPSYQEYSGVANKRGVSLIGSPEGGKNIVQFHQDVFVYKGQLAKSDTHTHRLKPARGVWLQMIEGKLKVHDQELKISDGAAIENLAQIDFTALEDSHFLLMDLI